MKETKEPLKFSNEEFTLIYAAVGQYYHNLRNFTITQQFDILDPEMQFDCLTTESKMGKLYKRIHESGNTLPPKAVKFYKDDTEDTPKKGIL